MKTILSSSYLDHTMGAAIDNENFPHAIYAETGFEEKQLYSFRTLADAEKGLAHIEARCTGTFSIMTTV